LLNVDRELPHEPPLEDSLGFAAAERPDHEPIVNNMFTMRQVRIKRARGILKAKNNGISRLSQPAERQGNISRKLMPRVIGLPLKSLETA